MSRSISELDKNFVTPKAADGLMWYDIRSLPMEGQGWSGDQLAKPFHRLPAKAQSVVRGPVWDLSQHTAGMYVRFVTNAEKIGAKWRLLNANLAMPHMPATGVSGLDLYVRDRGRWHWRGVGVPTAQENSSNLTTIHPPADGGVDGKGGREYMIYLPLYNGIEWIQIGVSEGATFSPGLPWPGTRSQKPVLFYGTSITHGGCACRPGMAYPAILGRMLEVPTINLGFSGNGPMEVEIGRYIAELDPSVYVLDCLPNMAEEHVPQRVRPIYDVLRAAHPQTPIVYVENIVYQGTLSDQPNPPHWGKNKLLRQEFGKLLAAGATDIYLVPGDMYLGCDGESTVDGAHPTDLGFMRQAETLAPVLRPLV